MEELAMTIYKNLKDQITLEQLVLMLLIAIQFNHTRLKNKLYGLFREYVLYNYSIVDSSNTRKKIQDIYDNSSNQKIEFNAKANETLSLLTEEYELKVSFNQYQSHPFYLSKR